MSECERSYSIGLEDSAQRHNRAAVPAPDSSLSTICRRTPTCIQHDPTQMTETEKFTLATTIMPLSCHSLVVISYTDSAAVHRQHPITV
ncbi:hypothetical protein TNCV_3609161 [Trichonephila clavipes]|nr:hypothetical protein TNCV_3609161 [Trichonephila clavipes]